VRGQQIGARIRIRTVEYKDGPPIVNFATIVRDSFTPTESPATWVEYWGIVFHIQEKLDDKQTPWSSRGDSECCHGVSDDSRVNK
jgi:hypothetical protein